MAAKGRGTKEDPEADDVIEEDEDWEDEEAEEDETALTDTPQLSPMSSQPLSMEGEEGEEEFEDEEGYNDEAGGYGAAQASVATWQHWRWQGSEPPLPPPHARDVAACSAWRETCKPACTQLDTLPLIHTVDAMPSAGALAERQAMSAQAGPSGQHNEGEEGNESGLPEPPQRAYYLPDLLRMADEAEMADALEEAGGCAREGGWARHPGSTAACLQARGRKADTSLRLPIMYGAGLTWAALPVANLPCTFPFPAGFQGVVVGGIQSDAELVTKGDIFLLRPPLVDPLPEEGEVDDILEQELEGEDETGAWGLVGWDLHVCLGCSCTTCLRLHRRPTCLGISEAPICLF